MGVGGFFSNIGKWAAIEHRLQTLEQITQNNNEKFLALLGALRERLTVLESDNKRVDQKIDNVLANVVAEAKGAAMVAATLAATTSIVPFVEKMARLEARLDSSGDSPKKNGT